jgi:hypothetical protein
MQQLIQEKRWLSDRQSLAGKYTTQLSAARRNHLPTIDAIERTQKEALRAFDRRMLAAMDQLVRQQLKRLADLRVPGFAGDSVARLITISGGQVGEEWMKRPVDCQIRLLRSIIACCLVPSAN